MAVCASDKVTLWASTPGFYTSRKGGGGGCSTTTTLSFSLPRPSRYRKSSSPITHHLFSLVLLGLRIIPAKRSLCIARESSSHSWGNKTHRGIKAGLVQGFAAKPPRFCTRLQCSRGRTPRLIKLRLRLQADGRKSICQKSQ